MQPGVHKLSMAEYLALPAVSASILQAVVDECPRAAWWRSWLNPAPRASDGTPASDAGTIAHSILLEGSTDCMVVVDAKDWRTKAAQEARDAARAAGKAPVLVERLPQIEAMVASMRDYIESLRESEPAIWALFQPGGGDSELTLVWDQDGTRCRARPDRISTDRKIIVDVKTGGTSAEPDTWGRTQLVRMGYYFGAAFYRQGVKALCGVVPEYVYLVVEQEPPFLCSLVGLEPAALDFAKRKVARALSIWRDCAKSGRWPGYPARVCYVEIPPWEEARFEGRPEEPQGNAYDPAKFYPSRDELARAYDSLPP